MSRIKLTNGFPKKAGLPVRIGVIIIEGDVKAHDIMITEDGTQVPLLEVKIVPVNTGDRRAVLTIPAEPAYDWHTYYGKELRVKEVALSNG